MTRPPLVASITASMLTAGRCDVIGIPQPPPGEGNILAQKRGRIAARKYKRKLCQATRLQNIHRGKVSGGY